MFFRSNLRCPSRLENCSGDQRFAAPAHGEGLGRVTRVAHPKDQLLADTNADVPNKERSGLNAFNDLIPD